MDFIIVLTTNTNNHKQYLQHDNHLISTTESLVIVYQTIVTESSVNRQLDTFMSMVVMIF